VTAVLPLQQSERGGSGSFLVRADDERRYWCKALNNPQHPRVPVNEQIVGRLGQLIGVATCDVALVRIPEALAGWEFRPGHALEAGWAHGSAAVEGVVETHSLDDRGSNENARRHAGFYALHDWVGGSDPQWLTAGGEDAAYYSHDHGHYFPGGPGWSEATLQQHGTAASVLGIPATGLDAAELDRLADRIDAATEEEIVHIVSNIPAGWPVTDGELERLVDFLLARRGPVAERLRAMMGTL
jgi:hypothetical protein